MGKGDRKTRRGKTASASYGNVRPRSAAKKAGAAVKKPTVAKAAVAKKAAPAKKAAAKKDS